MAKTKSGASLQFRFVPFDTPLDTEVEVLNRQLDMSPELKEEIWAEDAFRNFQHKDSILRHEAG